MNTPFLQQVAQYYSRSEGLEDYCFVFPNRRGGQFFSHYLQLQLINDDVAERSVKPHLMPCVTSINELVTELTGTSVATDIEMIFALYDAYCQAMGDKAQEFDKFIYWAQLIIGDFNDIDKSLNDAEEIYRNLSDLHNLGSNYLTAEVQEQVRRIFGDSLFLSFFDASAEADLWQKRSKDTKSGEVKQEFMSLWNALATIYKSYHEALAGKGLVSPGMQLRQAAETSSFKCCYSKLVFVGFGVLSAAEVKLMDHFKAEQKADFWWDNAGLEAMFSKAPHDPGALLIDGYCKHFGATAIEPLDDCKQTLRVVSVPSGVGQAKVAFDEVVDMWKDRNHTNLDTAIVLPDENLLVPLLHSVHDVGALNVTLGYPLRSSGIVSLMHIVARLHHQATKEKIGWTYYREDVYDILSHPLIKTFFTKEAMAKMSQFTYTNRFRIPASEFEGLGFSDLFAPAMDSEQGGDEHQQQSDYLDHLLAFCNRLMERMQPAEAQPQGKTDDDEALNTVELPLQQAFLTMYIDVLTQLKQSLSACERPLQSSTVFYLIDRLSSTAMVPFTGEPLHGLQIMGLLETRSLDFDNVVILSMNEKIFPRHRSINSFIPNYIRRAHGMSTTEQQEAIVSFNFYRLLNRARHVTMIYDSSVDSMGSSEKSRFITQLEKVHGKKLDFVEMNPTIETSSAVAIHAPNKGYDDLLRRYLQHHTYASDWYLSPSAINKYIGCPLQFYLHYIQNLNNDSDAGDFMDSGTFGTIVHDTLDDCYNSPQLQERHGLVDVEYIKWFEKNAMDKAIVRNIKRLYLHVPEDKLATDTTQLRGEALMLVDTIKSYVKYVLDYDVDKIAETGGPFTVIECETTHNRLQMDMAGVKFNFTYKPDRVDRLNDGTVRIVDYKTGSDETTFSKMDDLFVGGKQKHRTAILQLFLYSYAYLQEFPSIGKITPVIYRISSMQQSGVWYKPDKKTKPKQVDFSMAADNELCQEFITRMAATISVMFTQPFKQCIEDGYSCRYCRFLDFCRRMPKSDDY